LQSAFFVFPLFYFLLMCFGFHMPRLSLLLTVPYSVLAFGLLFESGQGELSRAGKILARWFARPLQAIQTLGSGVTRKITRAGLIARTLVIAAILISQIHGIVRAERYYYAMKPTFILEAAEVLKNRIPAGSAPRTVMARKPHIAYYSGMEYVSFPNVVDDAGRLVAFARAKKADFIIFSPIENLYYPGSRFLQQLHKQPGVRRIYRAPNLILYEVDGDEPRG
jgi:hypothetical protein